MPVYKTSNSGLLTRREYTSFLAGNDQFIPWAPSGAYDSIATTTVGAGGASTVTFSSIPSTYTHLQVRYIARSNRATSNDGLILSINSDTTSSNYACHGLFGDGTSASAFAETSSAPNTFNGMKVSTITGSTGLSSSFASGVVDILDYTNTSKNTTVRTLYGFDTNGSPYQEVGINSGLWLNTAAITSIRFNTYGGTAFPQYTQFALYGVKGQ